MKYIRVASDLHLEQYLGRSMELLINEHLPADERDAESVLTLAGDISSSPSQLVEFISKIENRFQHVIHVCGNHEFYKHDMTAYVPHTTLLFQQLKNTSFALDTVKSIVLDGVQFIFGTLWADGGGPIEQLAVQVGLADFYLIARDQKRFTVDMMRELHERDRAIISSFLKQSVYAKKVVVTHHMPSLRLCHPRFGNSINGGFASNCEDLLGGAHAPQLWIHGHTHDTIDRQLFDTRIVCNPSGYRLETRRSAYNIYGPMFVEL